MRFWGIIAGRVGRVLFRGLRFVLLGLGMVLEFGGLTESGSDCGLGTVAQNLGTMESRLCGLAGQEIRLRRLHYQALRNPDLGSEIWAPSFVTDFKPALPPKPIRSAAFLNNCKVVAAGLETRLGFADVCSFDSVFTWKKLQGVVYLILLNTRKYSVRVDKLPGALHLGAKYGQKPSVLHLSA